MATVHEGLYPDNRFIIGILVQLTRTLEDPPVTYRQHISFERLTVIGVTLVGSSPSIPFAQLALDLNNGPLAVEQPVECRLEIVNISKFYIDQWRHIVHRFTHLYIRDRGVDYGRTPLLDIPNNESPPSNVKIDSKRALVFEKH
ncbi:uncharacterized protein ARMOST_20130 [Armillaria ostoyae]|uniref:Uncharacterized protein n=1 Tax=Armillaria ostoyae TaxID=47428 RepID=A0A284S6I2_ARMOS|nr:uncharacterized protein ARMOST_20130 [Armillaria ostoyae]